MTDERCDDKGDDKAEGCGERRENKTFDEELADEAQARSAECAAERGFVTARHGASELQVSNICAGDQEHSPYTCEEDEEGFAIVAGDVTL